MSEIDINQLLQQMRSMAASADRNPFTANESLHFFNFRFLRLA